MKKKLISMAACALLVAAVPATCFAAEAPQAQAAEVSAPQTTTEVEYFADGSTLTTTLTVYNQPMARSVSVKTADKTQTYKNSSGKTAWTFTLTATFSYDRLTTSVANEADYSYNISDKSWSISGASASKSGNTATAKANFSGAGASAKASVTLRCDPFGNVT